MGIEGTGFTRTVLDPIYCHRVRDNIHGTILFSELERKIIDHPLFQRLREIRHLAFVRYVFFTAGHSRFEHSVGAMHLADKALRKMLENQEGLLAGFKRLAGRTLETDRPTYGDIASTGRIFGDMMADLEGLRTVLRLTMLLHDVGHGPFSHSSECCFPKLKELMRANRSLLTPTIKQLLVSKLKKSADIQATHEDVSMLIMSRISKDIPELSADLLEKVISVYYGMERSNGNVRNRVYNLLHDLVSNEIDADRMDYLIRDSRQCGVSYGVFDYERLLDSFAFYNRPSRSGLVPTLGIKFSGLQAFEDYLLSRYQMYSQVYFHKTSIAFDAMVTDLVEKLKFELPAELNAFAEIRDAELSAALKKALNRVGNSAIRKRLMRTYEGIFEHRTPWKRIYEVNLSMTGFGGEEGLGAGGGRPARTVVADEVTKYCRKMNVGFQIVEADKWFTRIHPRTDQRASENRLKIIKKNVHGIPFVLPIENYSPIIDTVTRRINLLRVYVEAQCKNKILARLDGRFRDLRTSIGNRAKIGDEKSAKAGTPINSKL